MLVRIAGRLLGPTEAVNSKLIGPRKTRPRDSPIGADLTEVCSRDVAFTVRGIVTTPTESG